MLNTELVGTLFDRARRCAFWAYVSIFQGVSVLTQGRTLEHVLREPLVVLAGERGRADHEQEKLGSVST